MGLSRSRSRGCAARRRPPPPRDRPPPPRRRSRGARAQPGRRPRPVVTGAERLQQRIAHGTADRAGHVGDELVVTRVRQAHVELGVELVELLHGQRGVVHAVQRRPHPVELRRCGVLRGELGAAALEHHAGLDDVRRAEARQRQVQPQQAGQRLAGQGGDDRRRAAVRPRPSAARPGPPACACPRGRPGGWPRAAWPARAPAGGGRRPSARRSGSAPRPPRPRAGR